MPQIALTISPPYKEGNHIDLFRRYLKKLSKLKGSWRLYPEFSDKMRLHFHGVMDKNNLEVYNYNVKYLENKFGFICIKPLKNSTRWLNYCTKEWAITKKYLGIRTYIDDLTILNFIEKEESPFIKWAQEGEKIILNQ